MVKADSKRTLVLRWSLRSRTSSAAARMRYIVRGEHRYVCSSSSIAWTSASDHKTTLFASPGRRGFSTIPGGDTNEPSHKPGAVQIDRVLGFVRQMRAAVLPRMLVLNAKRVIGLPSFLRNLSCFRPICSMSPADFNTQSRLMGGVLAWPVLPSSSVGEESLSPNHPDTSSRF